MSGEGGPAPRASRIGSYGLLGLLVAALALGVYVYLARSPDLELEVPKFQRALENGFATLELFVRDDEPNARIEIVGRDQVLARTLAESIPLEADERVTCVWDATDDEGDKVDPGKYRLRVTLPGQDRVMVFPRRIDVDPGTQQKGYVFVTDPVCEPSEDQG